MNKNIKTGFMAFGALILIVIGVCVIIAAAPVVLAIGVIAAKFIAVAAAIGGMIWILGAITNAVKEKSVPKQ